MRMDRVWQVSCQMSGSHTLPLNDTGMRSILCSARGRGLVTARCRDLRMGRSGAAGPLRSARGGPAGGRQPEHGVQRRRRRLHSRRALARRVTGGLSCAKQLVDTVRLCSTASTSACSKAARSIQDLQRRFPQCGKHCAFAACMFEVAPAHHHASHTKTSSGYSFASC